MREVCIVGVGIHRFGRFEDKPYWEMGQEVVHMALKDASMSWPQIQQAFSSTLRVQYASGTRILLPMGRTGIPIADIAAGCASAGVSLKQGVIGIQSGRFDTCLILGAEKAARGFAPGGYDNWQYLTGMTINPSYWAMSARRHMYEYGTTDLQMAKVAYKSHKYSVHNPYAMYQKQFSIEEILGSTVICDPIHLFEICATNEGAAAVILCPKDMAHKYTSKPVTIAAVAHVLAFYSASFEPPAIQMSARISNPSASEVAAKKAYEEAGIGPEDIDVAEVQDTCSFSELALYEELGFCKVGESGRLIDEGETEIDGRIPVNISGGLISKGDPVGATHLGQVVELVWQLRGENGPRQVEGAKTAMAHVFGSDGHCAITVLKR